MARIDDAIQFIKDLISEKDDEISSLEDEISSLEDERDSLQERVHGMRTIDTGHGKIYWKADNLADISKMEDIAQQLSITNSEPQRTLL